MGRLDRHRLLPVFLLLINLALHRLLFFIASSITTALKRMLTATLWTVKFEGIVEIWHDLVKVGPLRQLLLLIELNQLSLRLS